MTPRTQILEPQPATIDDYIARLVAGAPELTQEQKDRLALVLRSGRTPDDREAA